MSTGMDFEEFCELKLTPRAGADQVFFEAAEQEREAMFPMPPLAVVNHLRSRGYDCRAESLELLVENDVVRPVSLAGWSQVEVDAAEVHVIHRKKNDCSSGAGTFVSIDKRMVLNNMVEIGCSHLKQVSMQKFTAERGLRHRKRGM